MFLKQQLPFVGSLRERSFVSISLLFSFEIRNFHSHLFPILTLFFPQILQHYIVTYLNDFSFYVDKPQDFEGYSIIMVYPIIYTRITI